MQKALLIDASLTHSTDHHCTASRMSSQQSDNASESSLPTHRVQHFASSPPISQVSHEKPNNMEKSAHFKSEPPATAQNDEAPKPSLRRINSEETERPPSAQRVQRDTISDSEESGDDELDADPAEKIIDFDWDDLHQRYHDAMNGCHTKEAELAQEWENLMNVQLVTSASM